MTDGMALLSTAGVWILQIPPLSALLLLLPSIHQADTARLQAFRHEMQRVL